jgi:hypothetical protein
VRNASASREVTVSSISCAPWPARCILVFWDAHGLEIAECVPGRILPVIAELQCLLFMHNTVGSAPLLERSVRLQREGNVEGNPPPAPPSNWDCRFRAAKSISTQDFADRNHITLESAITASILT